MKTGSNPAARFGRRQRGLSLIVVMLLLVIVSILGAGAAQIALLAERSTRNDRDAQVAWQAAEAALTDSVIDIRGSAASTTNRSDLFGVNPAGEVNVNSFVAGCSTSGRTQGLCASQTDGSAKPIWLTVDFMNATTASPTVAFGAITGRKFTTGTAGSQVTGVQPSRPPRYMVELVRDTGASRDAGDSNPPWAFRVTAMGFGPRDDIQAVLQMVYRN
jgi:type IV pilus assembly protein PilX